MPRFLTKCLPKPVGSKAKTSSPLRNPFSAGPCSSFDKKTQCSSDKTASTTTSKLISLAAAGLAFHSCISSSSSSSFMSFKVGLQ